MTTTTQKKKDDEYSPVEWARSIADIAKENYRRIDRFLDEFESCFFEFCDRYDDCEDCPLLLPESLGSCAGDVVQKAYREFYKGKDDPEHQ